MADVVFIADFTSRQQWIAGRTSAYPNMGPTNPGDHKLDHLVHRYCPGGVFTADARPGRRWWNCDLLTTEGSPEGFRLRSGDTLDTTVTLPTGLGAWPAIWTWRDGGNEIDIFEYHPDHPHMLELSNHVNNGHQYWTDPSARVQPGGTVDLGTVLGAHSVDWYVGGTLVYADGLGVGPDWSAHLTVNISVSDGTYHPLPDPGGPSRLSWVCHNLTVTR